jgi:hypothetical protein
MHIKEEKPVKKPYQAPQLTVYGDVKKITQGLGYGPYLDWIFTRRRPGRVPPGS